MMKPGTAVAIVFALLAVSPARALDVQRQLTDYSATSWTEWNGTPLGAIYTVAQDRDGYLWVGGPSGLLRFDGVRFADVSALGLSPLPEAPVMALRRLAARWRTLDRLWGRQGRPHHPQRPRRACHAGDRTGGLRDRSARGRVRRHLGATDRGLFRHDARWEEIPLAGNVRGQQVLRVHVGRTGTLRVGHAGRVCRSGTHNGVFHPVGPQNVPVAGISEDARRPALGD